MLNSRFFTSSTLGVRLLYSHYNLKTTRKVNKTDSVMNEMWPKLIYKTNADIIKRSDNTQSRGMHVETGLLQSRCPVLTSNENCTVLLKTPFSLSVKISIRHQTIVLCLTSAKTYVGIPFEHLPTRIRPNFRGSTIPPGRAHEKKQSSRNQSVPTRLIFFFYLTAVYTAG